MSVAAMLAMPIPRIDLCQAVLSILQLLPHLCFGRFLREWPNANSGSYRGRYGRTITIMTELAVWIEQAIERLVALERFILPGSGAAHSRFMVAHNCGLPEKA